MMRVKLALMTLGLFGVLVFPDFAWASHTYYYPTVDLKLTVGDAPPLYRSIERFVDRGAARAFLVWGVMPIKMGPCMASSLSRPPPWFKNQTAIQVVIAPSISDKGDPVFFPDGDRRYMAVLDRITQVGQTVEVKEGCRRAVAILETERVINELGTRGQFPPYLHLDQTPLGQIKLRVRIHDLNWGMCRGAGLGRNLNRCEFTTDPW